MKNKVLLVALALSLVACNSRSGKLAEIREVQNKAVEKYIAEREGKKHNIVLRFVGKDKDIPKDGQLMVVKCSLEDTVIVAPATLDDAREES